MSFILAFFHTEKLKNNWFNVPTGYYTRIVIYKWKNLTEWYEWDYEKLYEFDNVNL